MLHIGRLLDRYRDTNRHSDNIKVIIDEKYKYYFLSLNVRKCKICHEPEAKDQRWTKYSCSGTSINIKNSILCSHHYKLWLFLRNQLLQCNLQSKLCKNLFNILHGLEKFHRIVIYIYNTLIFILTLWNHTYLISFLEK